MATKIDRAVVHNLKASGLSQAEVARRLGCSQQYVSRILADDPKVKLADYGLDRRRKLTDRDLEEIAALYDEGASISSIARRFGVTDVAIRYHVYPAERVRINKRSMEWRAAKIASDEEFRRSRTEHVRNTMKRRAEVLEKIKKGEISKCSGT